MLHGKMCWGVRWKLLPDHKKNPASTRQHGPKENIYPKPPKRRHCVPSHGHLSVTKMRDKHSDRWG